jgi:hypothetical protein
MCTFQVGQKVVCIDDTPRTRRGWVSGTKPTLREIYTITRVAPMHTDPNRIALWFEEITNWWPHPSNIDAGYNANRFRPVKTTNIDVFLKLLEPTPETEKV